MSLEVSIKKRFKGFYLDTAFTTEGGCLGILGASGCGKSMTLKCLAGIETPDEGRIVVNGRVLFDSEKRINLPPQQRKVGYLFQNYALFPKMTVAENIACGMPGRKGEKQAKIKSWLEHFHLEGLGERYPDQLSGGQQQRVALARMLVCEPEVLLLDEPFSALDAYLKEQLQVQLNEMLQEYGKDAILVTHSRDEVYRFCRELLVMGHGRLLEHGETKAIFKKPRLLEIARLTGCRNISRALRIEEKKIEAVDWGIVLETATAVPSEITHVGICAHDFSPARKEGQNVIPIEIFEQTEDPFEWNILFTVPGSKVMTNKLWWKISKQALAEKPGFLSVAPEDVLLLESGGSSSDSEVI